jgi:drug/metabolite transporter (DMT)-like permease
LNPRRNARLFAAFGAVYVIWGSTYLAIHVAIGSIPPLWMAGARFLISGAVLYFAGRLGGAPRPSRSEFRHAVLAGTLLLAGGNGGVSWAERLVPSGAASLLIATVPLWMVLFEWASNRAARPSALVLWGIAIGFGGIWLLTGGAFGGAGTLHPLGSAVLLGSAILWAAGSIYSRRAALPRSAIVSTGLQMLCGGAALAIAGATIGEGTAFRAASITPASLWALAYLIVFGSFAGFTAYVWLLQNVPAERVATYAYVNPIVAVLLGGAFLGEALTPRMIAAAGVIVLAVFLIVSGSRRTPEPAKIRE